MSSFPEENPELPGEKPESAPMSSSASAGTPVAHEAEPAGTTDTPPLDTVLVVPPQLTATENTYALAPEPPLFQSWAEPAPPPVVRIPHLGHLCLFSTMALIGMFASGVLFWIGVRLHLFGVKTLQQAATDVHYTLGTEMLLYLFTLLLCLFIFPLFWNKSFLAGLQWNGATALRLRWRLVGAAGACLLLAVLNILLAPGPDNTPIEKIFREPGAAWLLFGFGVTFAPFFEEMAFRGFLLPGLCTAYDWCADKLVHAPMRPLGENGHPQWSMGAMVTASILTSIPFAGMHAAQTGYTLAPFLLLLGVSLVLCVVRLWTRSLASSVVVHAAYNFMLFTIMLLGTDGFRHLDKM